jgi:hypothetical protein
MTSIGNFYAGFVVFLTSYVVIWNFYHHQLVLLSIGGDANTFFLFGVFVVALHFVLTTMPSHFLLGNKNEPVFTHYHHWYWSYICKFLFF